MMSFKNQLAALVLFIGMQSASAGGFSSFRFSKLLYAMHACSHPGNFCPVPPCDMNHFDHPLCKHYVCQGGGKDKYCTFIGNCDGDVDCVKTAKYMSLDEDYYLDEADVQSEADYNENFSGRGINSTSSRSWLAYGILGGVLTAFIILAVLRKRSIDNKELATELQPQGEDLSGVVARHHAQSKAASMV